MGQNFDGSRAARVGEICGGAFESETFGLDAAKTATPGARSGPSKPTAGLNPDIAATSGGILSLKRDTVKMRGGAGRLPVGRLQSPPDTHADPAPFTHDYRKTRVGYGRGFQTFIRPCAGVRKSTRRRWRRRRERASARRREACSGCR